MHTNKFWTVYSIIFDVFHDPWAVNSFFLFTYTVQTSLQHGVKTISKVGLTGLTQLSVSARSYPSRESGVHCRFMHAHVAFTLFIISFVHTKRKENKRPNTLQSARAQLNPQTTRVHAAAAACFLLLYFQLLSNYVSLKYNVIIHSGTHLNVNTYTHVSCWMCSLTPRFALVL